jgi:hypothetical protein
MVGMNGMCPEHVYLVVRLAIAEDKINGSLDVAVFEVVATRLVV